MSNLKLSVVVAAWNNVTMLERCLKSLVAQCDAEDTELIVVSNYDDGTGELIRTQFPTVKHLLVDDRTTVPQLRAKGILQSTGDLVALLEDQCFVDKDWCIEIKKALALPYPAVGGSVENASTDRAIDWAVYFYDFGRYMLPGRAGATDSLSGNNVAYKRSALDKVRGGFRNGFFETFINWELKTTGSELYFVPSAIVYHNKSYNVGEAFTECYHHGRVFAGKRVSNAGWLKRAGHALGSTLLPVILPGRIVIRTLRNRRHIRELMLALPHVLLLMASWSCGEFTGYLCGEGGSGSKWA